MNPLISVIIPIFNAEKYLNRCIDSIISQTYHNLEVILLDDGSTDNSGNICDEYALKDSRIRVIHQSNKGLVATRQVGISIAKGEYIAWVDSDDWIALDTYEQMCKLAVNGDLDIVWCDIIGVMSILPEENKHIIIDFSDNAKTMVSKILRSEVPGWIWNKLIKTEYLRNANIHVFAGDDMLEDVLFSIELLCSNPKMGHVNNALYYYNRTNESAMTAVNNNDTIIKGINNIKHVYDYLLERDMLEIFKRDFAYIAMKAKMALFLSGNSKKAKSLFSYSHKSIAAYRMNAPVSWIYWCGFNCGFIGRYLLSMYIAIKRSL